MQDRIAVLENKLQADEAELKRILRRENVGDIPKEIIMQSQIWHRESKEIHTNGGFTVYPGLLVTDQRVAIKMSQKKAPTTEAGRHFGRVSILIPS
jgi:hypothetical protein